MTVSTRSYAGLVCGGSAAVLGAAYASQYWGGLHPCELCLAERWPWAAAIVVAGLALWLDRRWIMPVLALVFVASAALAFYHVGVERRWFAGPSACTAESTRAQTLEELKRQLIGRQPVRCDEVQWALFGVSLAGWNLVASLGMAGLSLAAARRLR
jgi:disulfide bond formation protein DsbB